MKNTNNTEKKIYLVKIIETSEATFPVKANSAEEAEEIVEYAYNKGEIDMIDYGAETVFESKEHTDEDLDLYELTFIEDEEE